MDKPGTLSETLAALDAEGYSCSFKLEGDRLRCIETERSYLPLYLTVVGHYRFEGPSNPDDMAVIYVVESVDGTKGTLVDAYGTYAAPGLDEFIKKMPIDERFQAHIG